jgi:hypothetical protein
MELMEGALARCRFVLAAFSALQPGAAHFGDEPLEALFAIRQGKRAHFFAIEIEMIERPRAPHIIVRVEMRARKSGMPLRASTGASIQFSARWRQRGGSGEPRERTHLGLPALSFDGVVEQAVLSGAQLLNVCWCS